MFNPRAVDDDQNMDNLNDEQVSSLQNYFDECIPDDVVEQSILSEAPVPELIFLKTRKVDQDVLALLPEPTQKPVKRADLDYQLISRRNKFTLGLLCKLWGKLAAARADPETFDVDSALTLVEQTEVNKLVEKNAIEVTKPSPNQFVSHIFLASVTTRLGNAGTSTPGGYATTSDTGPCLWLNSALWEFFLWNKDTESSIQPNCRNIFQNPKHYQCLILIFVQVWSWHVIHCTWLRTASEIRLN